VAQGLSKDGGFWAKVDFSSVERRFTHGDPFSDESLPRLRRPVLDSSKPRYAAETGKGARTKCF